MLNCAIIITDSKFGKNSTVLIVSDDFQTNFDDKLLVYFCTLLASRFNIHPLSYFI